MKDTTQFPGVQSGRIAYQRIEFGIGDVAVPYLNVPVGAFGAETERCPAVVYPVLEAGSAPVAGLRTGHRFLEPDAGDVGEKLTDESILGPDLGIIGQLDPRTAAAFLAAGTRGRPAVGTGNDKGKDIRNTIVLFLFDNGYFSLFSWKQAIDEDNPPVVKAADTPAALGEFLSLYVHQFLSASSSSCLA